MELPTEEDVLAALVLEWLLYADGGTLGVPDNFELPPMVDAVVHEMLCDWDLEQAIADSERRLEVERAERAVLSMLRHGFRPFSRRERLDDLEQEPTADEVLRWAWTRLHPTRSA
ncbi:MAG TPA: hypothetical protein VFP50_15275 [Anaeromyxobacteraceae bacterium]|nr:hypothetical protein [Anaeromyxobacteraceae bacterium]